MPNIKNQNYHNFFKNGIIKIIEEEDIKKALENIKGKYKEEGRALLILLYYTGARPEEALKIKGKDITRSKHYIKIRISIVKGGLPRTIFLQYKRPLVKELYEYACSCFNEMFIFFHYRSDCIRVIINKIGEKKYYHYLSNNLQYHIKKWFKNVIEGSIPPYYLRHNRISKWILAGMSIEEARLLKGSRTVNSVVPYIHLSAKIGEKAARKTD